MAYPVVAGSSTGTYQNYNAGSATVSLPAGTAAGDLMVAIASCYSDATTITPPSGWTTIASNVEFSYAQLIVWKYATAADVTAGSYSFSIGATLNNNTSLIVGLLRITGADATTPFDVSSSSTGNGTSPATTSVTPASQELYLLIVAAGNNAGTGTVSGSNFKIASNNPSWTTTINSYYGPGVGYTGSYVGVAHANGTVIAATGVPSATLSNTSYYTIAFLVLRTQPITVSPLSMTGNMPSVTIRRLLQPSPLSASATLTTPAYAGSGRGNSKWNDAAKTAPSSISNLPKS